MSIFVRYLPKEDIFNAAEAERNHLGLAGQLPVPIELVIERAGIDIIPVPNLRKFYEVDALTSRDLKAIRVDAQLPEQYEFRYFFSLAHEYGHMVLHKDIYEQVNFKSIDDWNEFITNGMSQKSYGFFEFQANAFAGYFLVPKDALAAHFKEQVSGLNDIDKFKGIPRDTYVPYILSHFARNLSPIYSVSEGVLTRRMETDGLADLIP